MKWSIAGIALGGCVSGILCYLLLTEFLWVGDSIVVKAFV
jgi:hypothetical protein